MKDFFHVMSDGPALCNDGNGCAYGFNSETNQQCASSITRGFKFGYLRLVEKKPPPERRWRLCMVELAGFEPASTSLFRTVLHV